MRLLGFRHSWLILLSVPNVVGYNDNCNGSTGVPRLSNVRVGGVSVRHPMPEHTFIPGVSSVVNTAPSYVTSGNKVGNTTPTNTIPVLSGAAGSSPEGTERVFTSSMTCGVPKNSTGHVATSGGLLASSNFGRSGFVVMPTSSNVMLTTPSCVVSGNANRVALTNNAPVSMSSTVSNPVLTSSAAHQPTATLPMNPMSAPFVPTHLRNSCHP